MNKTINQLDSITTISGSDEVAGFDVSESKTGKITVEQIADFANNHPSGSVSNDNAKTVSGGAVYFSLVARQGILYRIPRWLRFSASSKTSLRSIFLPKYLVRFIVSPSARNTFTSAFS